MKRITTVVVPIAIALLSVACASQKAAAPAPIAQPTPAAVVAPEAKKPSAVVAEGQIREALVHLQRVHFALNEATLTPNARQALTEAARLLADHPEVELHVQGHTDQRGSDAYNMALGKRRAQAVVDFLATRGIERHRLHTVSFGKKSLLDAGRGKVAFARNRRVDFQMLKGEVQFVLNDGTLLDDRGQVLSSR